MWGKDLSDLKTKKVYYPDIEKNEIFVQGYIRESNSTHSRGSTVNLTSIPLICTDNVCKSCTHCTPLDMGSQFDFFGEQSHCDYINITPQQRANRLLLKL